MTTFTRVLFCILLALIGCSRPAEPHMGSFSPGQTVLRGTNAGKPSAGVPGRIYFTSDTSAAYFDTGSAWVSVSAGGGGLSLLPTIAPTTPPNASTFTWLHQLDSSKATAADGTLQVTGPPHAGVNLSMAYKAIPAKPYTITLGILPNLPINSGNQSIGVALTDGTKIYSIVQQGNVSTPVQSVFVQTFNSATSFNSNVTINSNFYSPMGAPVFLRIQDDNTHLSFYSSSGGRENGFQLQSQQSSGDFLTATGYGPVWQSEAGTLEVDIFSLTATSP